MKRQRLSTSWGILLVTSGVVLLIGIDQRVGAAIVVANRASGSISVINDETNQVIRTVPLPDNGEPMYVVYIPTTEEIAVGDRANNRVVFFDQADFSVTGTAPAGNGVFHMWAEPQSQQLWVNNDIDNTSTVINPVTKAVVTTVLTPADLVANGGKPHDVILDPSGDAAYVSVLGLSTPSDVVVKFSTSTFLEETRTDVGKDPHLSVTANNDLLYVPAQNSNEVGVFNRATLDAVTTIDVPGAHGASMAPDGQTFYTTNLPGGGPNGLYAIDTATNAVVGNASGVDTPFPTPHNIAITGDGSKLFITHSGAAADTVSYYSLADPTLPVLLGDVTVGLNPFGLAYVAVVPEPSAMAMLIACACAMFARRRK